MRRCWWDDDRGARRRLSDERRADAGRAHDRATEDVALTRRVHDSPLEWRHSNNCAQLTRDLLLRCDCCCCCCHCSTYILHFECEQVNWIYCSNCSAHRRHDDSAVKHHRCTLSAIHSFASSSFESYRSHAFAARAVQPWQIPRRPRDSRRVLVLHALLTSRRVTLRETVGFRLHSMM